MNGHQMVANGSRLGEVAEHKTSLELQMSNTAQMMIEEQKPQLTIPRVVCSTGK